MSAITGIFYRDGRIIPPEMIKKMNDRLSHRGPDGSKVWVKGSVALGHQMLHTTPESLTEELPFEDPDSGLVITADARIDNRSDLAALLEISDSNEVSDSYFILKAYQKWGEKCTKKLLGDFAFAIWDPQKDSLFCARDHMGVKTFCYYVSDNLFLFATEIKALFIKPELKHSLNKLKIALELKLGFADKKATYYRKINNLGPASSLILSKNDIKEQRYWQLDPDSLIILDNDEKYFDTFKKIFFESVKCRLRSAFPIGFELSGGLDSSSIVCTAKKILNENNQDKSILNTFSHIYNDFKESDERYYIKKVTETGEINSNFIESDKISLMEDIEKILWHQDQPYTNSFLPILFNTYKEMRAKNVRIILGGYCGDPVISHGERYFIELLSNYKFNKFWHEIKSSSKRMNVSICHLLLKDVIIPYLSYLIPRRITEFLRRINIIKTNKDFLDSKLSKETQVNDHLNDFSFKHKKLSKAAKEYHYHLITQVTIQDDMDMIDRAVSALSLEHRHPYLDKRLIEFCYAIPSEMKYKNGWDRFVQRNSMEKVLPKEIQWRRGKKDIQEVLITFLSSEKELIEKNISNHNSILDHYVDWKCLKKIYEEFHNGGNIDYLHAYYIWYVILLSLWIDDIC